MKWGLIARSETDRGLGIQTYAMWENLKPDRTLVVIDTHSGFVSHPGHYPGATHVTLKHNRNKNVLDETTVRDWWSGLDVVITVETFYDWDLIQWAKADGVRTIIHGNPEFFVATRPQPDTWIWPTEWRLPLLPPGLVVPVPVPRRTATSAPPDTGTLHPIHIAGNRAYGDRNGTNIVCLAMKRLANVTKCTIYSQAPVASVPGVRLRAPVADRWEMYKDQHVLILPRRYGGLCLPVQEAMASGLAVAMTNCSPNTRWPIIELNWEPGRVLRMQTGDVELSDTTVPIVADAIKQLANNRTDLAHYMSLSREWAEANSWDELAGRYYDVLCA